MSPLAPAARFPDVTVVEFDEPPVMLCWWTGAAPPGVAVGVGVLVEVDVAGTPVAVAVGGTLVGVAEGGTLVDVGLGDAVAVAYRRAMLAQGLAATAPPDD